MKCFITPTETIVMKYVQAIKKVDGFEVRGEDKVRIFLLQVELNGGTTYEKAYEDEAKRNYDYEALQYDLTELIKD